MSSSRDKSRRSKSPTKPPLATSNSRRSRRSKECVHDNQCNDTEYESPTESLSSSLSSYPVERNSSAIDKYPASNREKDLLHYDSGITRINTMSDENTSDVLPSENGAMIEVEKITALVEEELHSQRQKHKVQINRTVAKFKDRQEKCEREIDQLRRDRDKARRELEHYKRSQASQKRAAERNDRLQSQQKNRIEILEEQKALFDELQEERDALLDEVSRTQQQQQKVKYELSALKVRVREDSQKRLSVMECLSASWDAEKKEAQQKQALLISELEIMSKTLKAEQKNIKNKSNEFSELDAQYRFTKTELRTMKMKMASKNEDIDVELKCERESRKRIAEEHKQILKLKNDEIRRADNSVRTLKAELVVARESLSMKDISAAQAAEGLHGSQDQTSIENNEVADPDVKMLREENRRLRAEIKELQKQVEAYLANMALQQEFCDSLKSRIYKEQENEQEQVEEIYNLRKTIKIQKQEAAAKDLQIEQLKQLLRDGGSTTTSIATSTAPSVRVKSKSSRNTRGEKKSSMKKSKSSRKSGYTTS